jgi:hypothetical protein
VQRWRNCSPAASFTNCVMTLCLLKCASANVSFYTNNSKIPNFELWHSCRKWAKYWKRTIHCCRFQKACTAYGVPDVDLFQTVDLWDRKNIALVTVTIFAIGRTVSSIDFRSNHLLTAVSVMSILLWFFRPCILFVALMFCTSSNDALNNWRCIAHIRYSVSCHIS